MTWTVRLASLPVLVALFAASASAQTRITPADISRLQDSVYLAERDVNQLKTRDASQAAALQGELADLGEEVIYLKVKLRKDGTLAAGEVADLEGRINGVRDRARGNTPISSAASRPAPAPAAAAPAPAAPAPAAPAPAPSAPSTARGSGREIPAGTELDVRLSQRLNSGTATVEDRFEATTIVDLVVDGRTLVPAGAVMRGVVSSVDSATRTNRTGRMTVTFDQLTFGGRSYPIRGTVTQALESEGIRGEAGRVGAGAGVGAIIGGILGGFKGALAGILIGGGGTIAATEGKEVELPQGSVLRVRIDSPAAVQ